MNQPNRLTYTQMGEAIEKFVKDPSNSFKFDVLLAQDKDPLEMPEVLELFKQSGWTIEEYHALTKYDRTPLEAEIEDIANTLQHLGYEIDFIDHVLVAFLSQRHRL